MTRMDYNEFKRQLIEQDLLKWVSNSSRDEKDWLYAVEEWAAMRYGQKHREEQARLAKYVIHPYYTGRDKGALMNPNPEYPAPGQASHIGVLLFDTPEEAWEYIFTVVQPNDERAKHNYRVITLGQYRSEL